MNLIPVIDVMAGEAVRAVRGNRQAYRPIVSSLCDGSDPVVVARALCGHCNSRRLYVADLDALLGRPAQRALLQALLRALPDVGLWLDAGFADAAAWTTLCASFGADAARVTPVFGSESIASRAALERCFDAGDAASARAVLSLDRRDGQRLDPAGCWDAPGLWPKQLIVMTLERVGADSGPDLETLKDVRRRAPDRYIVGAGGIRDAADLARAADAGAAAWLVASALHDGRLPRADA